MSESSRQAGVNDVYSYIDTLLNENPRPDQSLVSDGQSGDLFVDSAAPPPGVNGDTESGGETLEFLQAGVGRFQILIAKSAVQRLLRFDSSMLEAGNGGWPLIEIRSHLQGREWQDFTRIEKGYCIELKMFKKHKWLLYLDTIRGICNLSPQSLHTTRLTAKWPWVVAVAAQPFRLSLDAGQLQNGVMNGSFQSRLIAWPD